MIYVTIGVVNNRPAWSSRHRIYLSFISQSFSQVFQYSTVFSKMCKLSQTWGMAAKSKKIAEMDWCCLRPLFASLFYLSKTSKIIWHLICFCKITSLKMHWNLNRSCFEISPVFDLVTPFLVKKLKLYFNYSSTAKSSNFEWFIRTHWMLRYITFIKIMDH